jgi:hypothetical protein
MTTPATAAIKGVLDEEGAAAGARRAGASRLSREAEGAGFSSGALAFGGAVRAGTGLEAAADFRGAGEGSPESSSSETLWIASVLQPGQ